MLLVSFFIIFNFYFFLSFFFSLFFIIFIVFSNPVHGSEATGEKVEFYFSIFMEYLVKHAPITN